MKFGWRLGNSATEASAKFHSILKPYPLEMSHTTWNRPLLITYNTKYKANNVWKVSKYSDIIWNSHVNWYGHETGPVVGVTAPHPPAAHVVTMATPGATGGQSSNPGHHSASATLIRWNVTNYTSLQFIYWKHAKISWISLKSSMLFECKIPGKTTWFLWSFLKCCVIAQCVNTCSSSWIKPHGHRRWSRGIRDHRPVSMRNLWDEMTNVTARKTFYKPQV